MKWLLLALMVGSTVAADLLQTAEMKCHGEIHDFRPAALGGAFARLLTRARLIAAFFFMAVSFFSLLKLLVIADLSFVVPASAATFVIETLLARLVLGERVSGLRWAGAALVACGVFLVAL
jgi:drug/metabolite transporter (DMT)-like permease